MSEVTVENVNVAEILGTADAMQRVEKVKEAITADPEVGALVKAAQSVEDVFAIVKKFAKVTLEEMKVLFQKTVDYFKETKAALSDDVLDYVSGGWSLSQWWKERKADIIGGVVFVACIVGGAVIGACTGGLGGAVLGACVGLLAGAVAGGVAAAVTGIVDEVTKK